MESMNVTQARKNLFEMVERAIEYNSVINISTKKGNAVLMSEDEYRGMVESLYLSSIPGVRESILEGKNTPISECVKLDWRQMLGGAQK